jgi:hypothetical protein
MTGITERYFYSGKRLWKCYCLLSLSRTACLFVENKDEQFLVTPGRAV